VAALDKLPALLLLLLPPLPDAPVAARAICMASMNLVPSPNTSGYTGQMNVASQ
jgi:hypothetical protein